MWPNNKDIPLFVGVPVIMSHRVQNSCRKHIKTRKIKKYKSLENFKNAILIAKLRFYANVPYTRTLFVPLTYT